MKPGKALRALHRMERQRRIEAKARADAVGEANGLTSYFSRWPAGTMHPNGKGKMSKPNWSEKHACKGAPLTKSEMRLNARLVRSPDFVPKLRNRDPR